MGLTSRVSGFVKVLEKEVNKDTQKKIQSCQKIDGVICLSHTEGGEMEKINNTELLLRTLAGFIGKGIKKKHY
jgi:altronate dehydratase